MGTLELQPPPTTRLDKLEDPVNEDDLSPIEEVRLTVNNADDPTSPVWTFRMWFLGLLSCCLLSFLNQFFAYRTEPLVITQITVQVATLPIGRFMAKALPDGKFRIPGLGSRLFSLNPGPFNMKEHVLISIFANAGSAFGSGSAYGVSIVNIIKVFYHRSISFFAGWLLIITKQVLGYGWAGLLRKYVVEPAHMWWPGTLVQVSLFRALHERDQQRMSRAKFFLINLPVFLGATGMMPPATPLNYNAWVLAGTIFNFFIFRYRKQWWQRYNYVLSAALDAGTAFMAVLLYFSVGMENKSITWWGTNGEHCELAACPTAKGVEVDGCPVN